MSDAGIGNLTRKLLLRARRKALQGFATTLLISAKHGWEIRK